MKLNYFAPLGAALLAIGGLALSATSAAAVDAWQMKCQAGGNMQVVTTWSASENRTKTEVFFKRAPVGAQAQAPAAGSCAWLDRGINANEPRKLTYVSGGGIEMRCSQRQCDAATTGSATLQLQAYVQAGAAFKVLVYNDNAGGFRVMQMLR